MSRPLFAHVAAMRHQIRRIRRTTVLGTVAMLPCAALLLATTPANWLILPLVLALAGYLQRKVRRVFWARRALKQLRLEEQFLRHSPKTAHVLTCLRRYNHLWTQSLTLKSLKALAKDRPSPALPTSTKQAHIYWHFTRSFKPLRPAHLPADLVWFIAVGLLWLWFVPEAVLSIMPAPVFAGLALLLLILTAEVIQFILSADLRDSFIPFATLLSAWTLTHDYETAFETVDEKPYRHTALYRSWIYASNSTGWETTKTGTHAHPLQPLELEADDLLLQAAEASATLQGHTHPG